MRDFYKKEEALRARANNAAATAEVPEESLSLVARRRKAREAEQNQQSQEPVTQDSVVNDLQSQEPPQEAMEGSQSVMDVTAGGHEIDTNTQAKSTSKRRRVIDSDDNE